MKNRLLLISLIMLLVCPNSFSKKVKTNSNTGQRAFYAEMKKMAASINTMLPQMTSDGSIMDHVAFENNTLILYYKDDKDMLEALKERGIVEDVLNMGTKEQAANYLKSFVDMPIYIKDGTNDYFDKFKKYKTSLMYKYGYIGEDVYFYQKKFTFDEWLSLYYSRALTKAPSAQYSLDFYKDIFELSYIFLPPTSYEKMDRQDVKLVGEDLYIDWYIDESLGTESYYRDISKISLSTLYDMHEFDMENGLKAYKIKVHNRFYSKQTNALLRDYTLNLENNF